MASIPDSTDAEQWTASTTLKQRWQDLGIEPQVADIEIRRHPEERELTDYPGLFWQVDEASFIIAVISMIHYRTFL